jgi:PAS domain S-box-containing protein
VAGDRFDGFKGAYLRGIDGLGSVRSLVLGLSILLSFFLFLHGRFAVQKRQSDVQLSRARELHGLMFSSLQEGILYCRPEGTILSCNQSAAQILGMDVRSIIGKDVSKVARVGDTRVLQEILKKGGSVDRMTLSLSSGTGDPRWIELRSQPVTGGEAGDPFAMILSLNDVTSLMKTRRQLDLERVESSKLSALGTMASEVAHEVNNPLTVILTSADLIEMKLRKGEIPDQKMLQTSVERIRTMVARATRITDAVLAHARGAQDDSVQETELRSLIEESLVICTPRLRKAGPKVEISGVLGGLRLSLRASEISQVLINLINNSADELTGRADGEIHIAVEESDGLVRIRISDNGSGIPPENRAKIFLPYFTSKPVGKGTGLGLSVSKGIVEAHGGKLYLDESSSRTTFVIELPRSLGDQLDRERRPAA